ncbi:hypothetical protein [Acidovorax sp. SUPP3334]|uniref:hypothetical protein n=1 Tax=Acidovorax sp. SUPP3334 TaxID=2920881 RepID=UPI0023DE2B92|nr:hypothetical protein [Acidovorax sp. SUPP3334]GKT20566.1 hypothetical protein AVHM3334_01515 [Acidovorax sp. SUPP3334]
MKTLSSLAAALLASLRDSARQLRWTATQASQALRSPALVPVRIDSMRRERPGRQYRHRD